MKVPYLDLGRAYLEHKDEYLKLADRVWSSGGFFFGDATESLEERLCQMTGRKHAVLVGSCTDALFFSLWTLGIGPGDEVIVASFSHVASLSCILRVGATPVFVDIKSESFMMDEDALDALVTARTKAIVAVHMFGIAFDFAKVQAVANKHGLKIIEDAAQSFGTSFNGLEVGSLGSTSCLSFDPLKALASMSYGGAVLTDDENVAELVERMRHHGRGKDASKDSDILGYNSKMPTLEAEIVKYRLSLFDDDWQRRKKISSTYLNLLADIEEIVLPREFSQSPHLWHKFNILCENRDALQDYLASQNVGTRRCWKIPLYREGLFTGKQVALPGVEKVCETLLTLPIYPQMTLQETKYVCETIREFYS